LEELMTLVQIESHRRTVETASGPVSYVEVGDGRPAVFVHGVATNALLWRHVMAGLADTARCLALDLPLHGHTPVAPGQDLTLTALAEVVEGFCDALGLDAVDLVANDTGGAVAQIFAARHPERLRTFTLTNCETDDNVPPPSFAPVVEAAAAGLLAPGGPALVADLDLARATAYGVGYEHPELVDDEVLRAYVEPVLGTEERGRQFERFLTSLHAADLVAAEPALRRLQVPTLVVWGTGDETFAPSAAAWLRDTIPGVTEVVELDGARLFFPEERPQELVAELRRFWAQT
jgi:pimeloyl-ACP methyl ester carboxylesterase